MICRVKKIQVRSFTIDTHKSLTFHGGGQNYVTSSNIYRYPHTFTCKKMVSIFYCTRFKTTWITTVGNKICKQIFSGRCRSNEIQNYLNKLKIYWPVDNILTDSEGEK